jgi:GDP-mannose transporter
MSNWGRVYYTNILSGVVLALIFPFCSHEHLALSLSGFSVPQMVTLGLSCVVGVAMSHAGYLMRSNVSATAGVVVGVVCKIGSVLFNLLIWDQHATPIQLVFLAVGLAGGSLFQQAPLRAQPAAKLPSNSSPGSPTEQEGLIKVFDAPGGAMCTADSDDGSTGSNSSSGDAQRRGRPS